MVDTDIEATIRRELRNETKEHRDVYNYILNFKPELEKEIEKLDNLPGDTTPDFTSFYGFIEEYDIAVYSPRLFFSEKASRERVEEMKKEISERINFISDRAVRSTLRCRACKLLTRRLWIENGGSQCLGLYVRLNVFRTNVSKNRMLVLEDLSRERPELDSETEREMNCFEAKKTYLGHSQRIAEIILKVVHSDIHYSRMDPEVKKYLYNLYEKTVESLNTYRESTADFLKTCSTSVAVPIDTDTDEFVLFADRIDDHMTYLNSEIKNTMSSSSIDPSKLCDLISDFSEVMKAYDKLLLYAKDLKKDVPKLISVGKTIESIQSTIDDFLYNIPEYKKLCSSEDGKHIINIDNVGNRFVLAEEGEEALLLFTRLTISLDTMVPFLSALKTGIECDKFFEKGVNYKLIKTEIDDAAAAISKSSFSEHVNDLILSQFQLVISTFEDLEDKRVNHVKKCADLLPEAPTSPIVRRAQVRCNSISECINQLQIEGNKFYSGERKAVSKKMKEYLDSVRFFQNIEEKIEETRKQVVAAQNALKYGKKSPTNKPTERGLINRMKNLVGIGTRKNEKEVEDAGKRRRVHFDFDEGRKEMDEDEDMENQQTESERKGKRKRTQTEFFTPSNSSSSKRTNPKLDQKLTGTISDSDVNEFTTVHEGFLNLIAPCSTVESCNALLSSVRKDPSRVKSIKHFQKLTIINPEYSSLYKLLVKLSDLRNKYKNADDEEKRLESELLDLMDGKDNNYNDGSGGDDNDGSGGDDADASQPPLSSLSNMS